MTQTTQKLAELLPATTTLWPMDGADLANVQTPTSRFKECQIHYLPDPAPVLHPGDGFISHDELLTSLGLEDSDLSDSRRWASDVLYGDEPVTLKKLRLQRGLSQAKLAELIGSKQSHISRIERGTEDISKSVMRKLRDALEIDMNTLDAALSAQEALLTQERRGRE
jgi:DNA-binding XRE family transcriptional regulator